MGIEDVEVVFVKEAKRLQMVFEHHPGKTFSVPHIKLNDFTKVGAVDNREFKT